MICPHCGDENLLGRVTCMSCAKSLLGDVTGPAGMSSPFAADVTSTSSNDEDAAPNVSAAMAPPPWEASPVPPAPAVAQREEIMCRICMTPFERPQGAGNVRMCPDCSTFDTSGADSGENEVSLSGSPALPGQDFGSRMGTADFRPAIKGAHKAGLRRGPLVIFIGLFLALVGVAVVKFTKETHRTDTYFREIKPVETTFKVAPAPDKLVRLTTTLNLWLLHESMRASFKGELDAKVDVHQRTVQIAEMALDNVRSRGAQVDVAVECRLEEQRGRAQEEDAVEVKIYPWGGHHATNRMLLTTHNPPSKLSGAEFVVGRDVPPLLTLGAISVPEGKVKPKRRWLAEVELPLLCNRDGAIFPYPFPCTFTYEGRRTLSGYQCHVIRMVGKAPRRVPARLQGFNRTGGQIRGALFYDIETGMLVEAHLDVDVNVTHVAGRVDERIQIQGQLEILRN